MKQAAGISTEGNKGNEDKKLPAPFVSFVCFCQIRFGQIRFGCLLLEH